MIERTKANGLLVPLAGYRVYVIGASPAGLSPQAWNGLRTFWTLYFREAGAELVSYSAECSVEGEKHMAHNHGSEYQVRIVHEDGTEELSGWLNSAEQVAQTIAASPRPHANLSDHFKSGQRLSLQNRPTGLAVRD